MTIDPLLVDTYAGDGYGQDQIKTLVSAGGYWNGITLKATEGTYYPDNTPSDKEWFLDNWIRCRMYPQVQGTYGKTFFRGAYHYFRVDEDATAQAEYFLSFVEQAGGWGVGDLWPMIDVESAENPANASAAQIEDGVSTWTAKVKSELGRRVTGYWNIYPAQVGVTSRMGCDLLILPRYTADLPPTIYQRIGWQLATPAAFPSLLAWQLDGDGQELVPGYPKNTPMGPCDYSALVIGGGGTTALEWLAANINVAP